MVLGFLPLASPCSSLPYPWQLLSADPLWHLYPAAVQQGFIQAFSTVLNFSHQILGKGGCPGRLLGQCFMCLKAELLVADCRLEISSEPQFWVLHGTMPFSERLSHVASVIKCSVGVQGIKKLCV